MPRGVGVRVSPPVQKLKLLFLEGLFLLYDGIGRHVTLLGVMPRGVGVRPDCYQDPTCTEIEASLFRGAFFVSNSYSQVSFLCLSILS